MAVASTVNQTIWFRKILKDLQGDQYKATVIFCDNKSVVAVKYYAIWQIEEDYEIKMIHYSLEEQIVDVLAKTFGVKRFHYLRSKMGMTRKHVKEGWYVRVN